MTGTTKPFGLIMAGGRGTRFWPLSTPLKPKQFLNLLPGGTMLELTAERLSAVCGRGNILVATGRDHAGLVMEQLPWLPEDNLLIEPEGRNTAPCIGWAASILARRGHGRRSMLVVASDHRIHPLDEFVKTALLAVGAADAGFLVTMGISPVHAATGYGYMEKGAEVMPGVYRVASFREKPDAATAGRYLETGRYLWNSGMFAWSVDGIIEALRKHMPALYTGLDAIDGSTRPDSVSFAGLPAVSIDVGVMEKADNVVVVPASFDWSDIGDWPGARAAGVCMGETLLVDSDKVLVYDSTGRLTVVMGLSNVSVVCTEEATLVMADSCAQKLRGVTEKLSEC